MAVNVVLTTVQINLSSDPQQYMAFPSMAKLQTEYSLLGQVRAYASGRRRGVINGSLGNIFNLDILDCTRAQINWLKSMTGKEVFVRDDIGTKFYGVYFKVLENRHPEDPNYGDVTLAIDEVTHTEAV